MFKRKLVLWSMVLAAGFLLFGHIYRTQAGTVTYKIDFGNSTKQTATTGWNNFTDPRAGSATALVDSTGATTSTTLQITDAFYYNSGQPVDFSTNVNGTTSSSVYPSTATSDSFFLGTLSSVTDNAAAIAIAGLDNTSTYDFRFYASRVAADTTNRTGSYTIGGTTVTLNATNNVDNYVDITGVSPSSGSITISIAKASGASFAYLGVLEITEHNNTNASPTADAGADQSITTPSSTVTLSGSGNDPDGTIASYGWSFISGPATPSIGSATSASTQITGLSAVGTYVFRLTVTDNEGATGTDDVSVSVLDLAKQSRFNLSLSAAAVPGWTNVHGNPASSTPSGTDGNTGFGFRSTGTANWSDYGGNNAQNDYGESVDDGGGFAMPADVVANFWFNYADPFATGVYQTQVFGLDPAKTYTLTLLGSRGTAGSATSPRVTDYNVKGATVLAKQTLDTWRNTSEMVTFTGVEPDSSGYINIAINKKSDSTGGAFGYLNGIVVTEDGGNAPPTADAGADQTIQLPTTTATLTGSATDYDGTISTYAWSFVSGPSTPSITSASAASTGITGLTAAGTYAFRLTVTDNAGATDTDDISVEVFTNSTVSYLIDLGRSTNQTSTTGWNNVTNPTAGTTVSLVDSNGDATAASLAVTNSFYYDSSQAMDNSININGTTSSSVYPSTATIDSFFLGTLGSVTDTAASVNITGLDDGHTYDFRFYASRVANDGGNRTSSYTIGATTVNLNATDNVNNYVDITGVSPSSGIVTINITRASGATFAYLGVLEITEHIPNESPTADAGKNKTITMPTSSITLSGDGHDTDGAVASYAWSEVSSNSATINNPNSASTTVSDLIPGTYTFRLTVTDNNGATGTDDVSVTVNDHAISWCTPKTIVILGSSTSAGYGISPSSDAYASLLETYFEGLVSGNSLVNLAVGGYTTYHIMPTGSTPPAGRPSPVTTNNITAALSYDPDAIVVNMPSNDTANGYTESEQQTNFQTIEDTADAAGVPIWFTTTQPRNLNQSGIDEQIAVRDWIDNTFGSHAIDFWTTFAASDGTIDAAYDQGDGIHLNNAAHKKLYSRVAASSIIDTICKVRERRGGGVVRNAGGETDNGTGSGTCADGVQNGNETGVDSGGRCANTGGGSGDSTGTSGGETDNGTGTGTCADGLQNGNETGIDTGGRCANTGGGSGGGGGDTGFLLGARRYLAYTVETMSAWAAFPLQFLFS